MLLALNHGSTGLKAASFALPPLDAQAGSGPREVGRVHVEASHDAPPAPTNDAASLLADAAELLADVARQLPGTPDVIAHRIVHGGDRTGPEDLTDAALASLEALSAWAPLHQPPALALVRATAQRWPQARQVGVFDTTWHQSMPAIHRVLAIPYALHLRGVKRYGFHGLAFQSALRQLGTRAPELARSRVVLAHLGGGSSLCAVRDGRCVNTTMGMTPLDGIPMSTRPGSLDPGVLLHLQRALGMAPDEVDQLLWHESGLKGLSGETGDMRQLLASDSEGARRAIDVYVAAVAQGIAAMAACMRGVDGLAFSGGIGAHAAEIRRRVANELEWLGLRIDPGLNRIGAREITASEATVRTFALAIDEELEVALAAASVAS